MTSPFIKLKININKLSKIKISKKDNNFENNKIFIHKNFKIETKTLKNFQIILIGSPVLKNLHKFLEIIDDNINNIVKLKKYLKDINGQFIIIINFFKIKKFMIVNDRFGSIPVYFFKIDENIYFSHLYYDLNQIKYVKKIDFESFNFLQVLFFNRMFSDYTFHKDIKYLLPASIYSHSTTKQSLLKYWVPNFKKKILKFNSEVGDKYIKLLTNSIERNLKEFKNQQVGIFLSGGHDSRSVLLASKKKNLSTLSVSFSNNYEAKVAKKVSKVLNVSNKFIKLEKNHFEKNINIITRINSGFYSFINTLFVGIEKKIPKRIKVLIHGHGLDYMFQGMYIPYSWIKIFNRPTFFKIIKDLNKTELTDYFIKNISYRVKGVDLIGLIKPVYRPKIKKYLYGVINNINKQSKKKSKNKYDNWEYIMSDTVSRHYSYPNVLSKLSLKQQRVVSFDNDLFDFYLSLDPKIRLQADCMRYLMKIINKDAGRIETGNWGLPASDGPFVKTLKLMSRKIFRHLTTNQKYKAPTSVDRTWPTTGDYLRGSKYFRNLLAELNNSIKFKNILYYLDWKKIDYLKTDLIEKKKNETGNFFAMLITLYLFLKKVKKI
jgi:hypothetical protein